MRITVDIDETLLREIKEETHISKNSPAIGFIVKDWVRRRKGRALLDKVMSGQTDYAMSNEELEQRLYGDPDRHIGLDTVLPKKRAAGTKRSRSSTR